eukprot:5107899-Pleurochrysis_carterae.AAC.1
MVTLLRSTAASSLVTERGRCATPSSPIVISCMADALRCGRSHLTREAHSKCAASRMGGLVCSTQLSDGSGAKLAPKTVAVAVTRRVCGNRRLPREGS